MGRVGTAGEAERATEPVRDVYGGGSGASGMTNVGGGDDGARLTETEGVVLRKACAGRGATQESLGK